MTAPLLILLPGNEPLVAGLAKVLGAEVGASRFAAFQMARPICATKLRSRDDR